MIPAVSSFVTVWVIVGIISFELIHTGHWEIGSLILIMLLLSSSIKKEKQ